ncbi:hypothetical protein [Ornithinimicrobium sp. F0845]|nr:hypothetical protein [Ornithinimicrobium sp. F0845]
MSGPTAYVGGRLVLSGGEVRDISAAIGGADPHALTLVRRLT